MPEKMQLAGDRVYQPQAYAVVLLFILMSMVCCGSSANAMKLTGHWPFPLFYWGHVIGVLAATTCLMRKLQLEVAQ